MAFMYIKELSGLAATDPSDSVLAIVEPDGVVAEQKIAIAAGNTSSAALNPATKWVEISVDAICSYVVGPTATVANARLNAGERVLRRVKPGVLISNIVNT
jgi:hypothetical protein